MLFYRSLGAILVVLLFVGVWLANIGLSVSNAQQSNTPRPTQTTPTPTPTPKPTVSPTPDAPIEDDEPLTVDTELVNVFFTVGLNKERRFINELKQEDIRVLEDGQPQEIFTFQRQVDLPLSLAILIDTSASQERTLPEEKDAAKAFVEDVVRNNKDEVAVLSFTGETTLELSLTGNKSRILRSIDSVVYTPPSGYLGGGVVVGTPPISGKNQTVAGSTAVWDALWITADEVLRESPEGTRRAMILISDGVDTYSRKKLSEAVDQALKVDAIVYCIGIGDNFYDGVDEGALRKIAERTGGRAYFPRSVSELQSAFTQIQQELRSQYLVAYAPSNNKKDGSFRKIQIEVTNPTLKNQNLRLTHRQGYFAKTESEQKKKTK
jgi:VWFA-related protein